MDGGISEEGRGATAEPVWLAVSVEGGEEVAALAGRGMEVGVGLPSGLDAEALAGAEVGSCDAREAVVKAGLGLWGHVEPTRQP